MDFDEESDRRRALAAGDPLPPDDWSGYGRSAAAEALYLEQQPQLVRYLRRHTLAQDVGDIVQESFRLLIKSRGDTLRSIESPRAYLIRTARNLIGERARTDERRQRANHVAFEEEALAGPDPHSALEARDALRRIEDRLARLDSSTRDIFLMHRFDGLSYGEIAKAKGMSVKRVEKHIAKAMIVIRRARAQRP